MNLLPEWRTSCAEAISLLTKARDLLPAPMLDATDAALRKVVSVRDGMIDQLRQASEGSDVIGWREALDTVNVTLTELVSVEYPGLLTRQHLDEAIELLQPLTNGAEPAPPG